MATATLRISTSAAGSARISMKWRRARALAVTKILVSVAFGRTLRAASRAFLRRRVRSSMSANFARQAVGQRSGRPAAQACTASSQIWCSSGSSAIASGSTNAHSDSSTNRWLSCE